MFNPNAKINKHQWKRFRELRPPVKYKDGSVKYPSCHDIDIVRRARTRLMRWLKNKTINQK